MNKVYFEKQILKLSSKMSQKLEGNISLCEAGKSLKAMSNNKSPGVDGYSCEFFKFFWKDVGKLLIRSLNYGFELGKLSITQKQGIISILPKPNKPREFLKFWRPITLLNVTYKILSSCITNRLK